MLREPHDVNNFAHRQVQDLFERGRACQVDALQVFDIIADRAEEGPFVPGGVLVAVNSVHSDVEVRGYHIILVYLQVYAFDGEDIRVIYLDIVTHFECAGISQEQGAAIRFRESYRYVINLYKF